MTRAPSKRRARIAAELTAPLPPVAETLAVLDQLATHQYETKARTRAAFKLAHHTLRDVLASIESYARYPNLVSRQIADDVQRQIRRGLQLDKAKRFPPLPRPPTPSPPPAPREVIAAAKAPPDAMSPARAAELFAHDGLEFDELDRGGAR